MMYIGPATASGCFCSDSRIERPIRASYCTTVWLAGGGGWCRNDPPPLQGRHCLQYWLAEQPTGFKGGCLTGTE